MRAVLSYYSHIAKSQSRLILELDHDPADVGMRHGARVSIGNVRVFSYAFKEKKTIVFAVREQPDDIAAFDELFGPETAAARERLFGKAKTDIREQEEIELDDSLIPTLRRAIEAANQPD